MNPLTSIVLAGALGMTAQHPSAPSSPVVPSTSAFIAMSDRELRNEVDTRLATIDTPISAVSWAALGPRAEPVLYEYVRNRENLPTQRAKAIDGWAAVGGDRAASVFEVSARAEAEPLVVRFAAVRGLGVVTPSAALPAALGSLLSTTNDSRVRAFAGEVLIRHTGRPGCVAVRAQIAKESDETRNYFGHALALCKGL